MNANHDNTSGKTQSQDTYFRAQLQRVYAAFFAKPMTMKEVDVETGIMRESVCRHCKKLRDQDKLFAIRKRRCTITNYPTVTEWTTNPDLAPKDDQLSLW